MASKETTQLGGRPEIREIALVEERGFRYPPYLGRDLLGILAHQGWKPATRAENEREFVR